MAMKPKNIRIDAYLDVVIGVCLLLTGIYLGGKYDATAMWLMFPAIKIVIAAGHRLEDLKEKESAETPTNDAK